MELRSKIIIHNHEWKNVVAIPERGSYQKLGPQNNY